MSSKKPENIDEYKKWLKNEHSIEISNITELDYASVTSKIKKDFKESEFWVKLTKNLREFESKYLLKTKYPLLTPDRKSTRLNSSHTDISRMPSSA